MPFPDIFGAWFGKRGGDSRLVSQKTLMRRLERDIAEQSPSSIVALCVISLSRGDWIEAVLGLPQCRAIDDELLRRVASTLRASDYMAMASPNEIWVVLPRLQSAVMAGLAASNLIGVLEPPILDGDAVVTVRPVIGTTLAARSGSTPLSMLKAGAAAEHHARAIGRRYWVDVTNERSALLGADILGHLQHALTQDGLALAYQPKVDPISGAIAGVEALVRWTDARHPAINPTMLVNTAEQFGLMWELTRFVLNNALREYVSFLSDASVGKVWINLSATVLRDAKLPIVLRQMAEVWGVDPKVLGFELTEGMLLTDDEQSVATLRALVAQGFSLAIDDFGTGYSSLAYLRRLPVSELKIDQLFVRNMATSVADRQIVRTIIDLAHNFQFTVVAEGAEDDRTLALLREMGCDHVQGYVYTRGLPAAELAAWARQHLAPRAIHAE